MNFNELNIAAPILRALEEEGYKQPTPVQAQSIPAILQRRDILGSAQTGTGKTAAFAIPILQILSEEIKLERGPKRIKALIVTPTRELAIQIGESFEAYGRHLNVRHTVIFGGIKQHSQTRKLKSGVDVLIATPGRLLDLMNQNYISLRDIKIFTLDEADRMLDMGFIHDVKRIISKLPQKKQSLFFSATMPPAVVELTHRLLVDPVRVQVTPVSSTAENVKQKLYHVEKANKKPLLLHILKEKDITSALIFTRTKSGANRVARFINEAGINAEAIHGNKSQSARQKALHNFKTKQTRVLVATDIAARGIDIDDLSHVINYEIPNVPETYVHRIGRTGRAGAYGIALSFCEWDEKKFIKDVEKLINKPIPVESEHPFPSNNVPTQASSSARAFAPRRGYAGSRGGSGGGRNGGNSRRRSYGGFRGR